MPKASTKSSAAVAPDLAESAPALSSSKPKTKKSSATRKAIAALPIGGVEASSKSTKNKSSKRNAKELVENESEEADSVPVPTKKTKLDAKTQPTSISAVAPKSSKGKTKKASVDSDDDEDDVAAEEVHLKGFSSGSENSSDEDDEDDGVDETPVDLGSLPTIAKDDATVKRKLEKAKKHPATERGVLYLGRIPHGFYEDQMRGYFNQFGDVTRVRLSRNKRTGRSKHYGFIEFDSLSVAKIVAETMDNYLLMGHILVCKVIPNDEVRPELWVGSNRKWRIVPMSRVARVAHNKERTEDEQKRVEKRLLKRQQQKQEKIAAAGIKYDVSSVGYKATVAA